MTPAGTSNELDVQNEGEENTHTHTLYDHCRAIPIGVNTIIIAAVVLIVIILSDRCSQSNRYNSYNSCSSSNIIIPPS